MYGEIYIDIVFATNLLMDYVLLRLVGMLFRCKNSRLRCFIAAVMGALFSCVMLLIGTDRKFGVSTLLHGVCAMGMVRIGLGIKKGSLLIKTMILLYLTAFLCGGFWEAIIVHRRITLEIFIFAAACTYFGIGAFFYLTDSIRARTKNIYPITLSYQGKVHSVYGFYDTGNMLTDIVNGEPVSIIKPEILNAILSEDVLENLRYLKEKPGEQESTKFVGLKPHFLPYQTVEANDGLLLAVTLEDLCIHTPGEVIHIANPVLAFSFGSSTLGKEYEVLLNSRLLY